MIMGHLRLVLGTAQLGFDYGINNKLGKPDFKKAVGIIKEALDSGINTFDTAQFYGDSEEVLGRVFEELGCSSKVKVISKFDPYLDHRDKDVLERALDESLQRLKVEKLSGIMLHSEEIIDCLEDGLGETLQGFIDDKKVDSVGVSVYAPLKAIDALSHDIFQIIQVPGNVLDRRFEDIGVFNLAREKGRTVFVRSVFLQGLILMEEEELSGKMSFAKDIVRRIGHLSRELGFSRGELALLYVKTKWPDAKVIFGAETAEQLRDNVALYKKDFRNELCDRVDQEFCNVDVKVLNPSLWPKREV